MLLHEVIAPQLESRPHAPAIIIADDGTAVSYAHLAWRAQHFAMRLNDLKLKPGARIAIIADKSPNVIATFLGSAMAGIVFAPLDVQASPAYWQRVLKELRIDVVFSNLPEAASNLSGFRVYDVNGDDDEQSEDLVSDERAGSAERSLNDDAYILATSGSTGRPKGVLLSHDNALSFAKWAANEVELGPEDRVLSLTPFHFDLSVFDIYASLLCGAPIVLAPKTSTVFVGQLIKSIEDHHVTILYTVPTVLRMLLQSGAFADGGGGSLRTIMYAGEPFPVPQLADLMRALPKVQFFNFFGPTETNVCLAHRVSGVPDMTDEVPIGQPASAAKVRLIDEAGQDVKPGEIGEIMVDGPTVMKGYIRADGFEAARRPYATGDFGQQCPDGLFYFRGRRDSQVKVRGVRIELAAVENALAPVAGVKEAAAVVVENDLVAFIAADKKIDVTLLEDACRSCLPMGAVPHKMMRLATLPRLSNGKLDLRKLKDLALGTK